MVDIAIRQTFVSVRTIPHTVTHLRVKKERETHVCICVRYPCTIAGSYYKPI